MRVPKNQSLGLILLVAGVAGLLLLFPRLFTPLDPAELRLAAPAPLRVAFGWGAFVLVVMLCVGGVALYFAGRQRWSVPWGTVALGELLLLFLLILSHLTTDRPLEAALTGHGGGLVGWAGSGLLTELAGRAGAWAIALAATLLVVGLILRQALRPYFGSEFPGKRLVEQLRGRLGGPRQVSRNPLEFLQMLLAWWIGAFRRLLPGANGTVESAPNYAGASTATGSARGSAQRRRTDKPGKGVDGAASASLGAVSDSAESREVCSDEPPRGQPKSANLSANRARPQPRSGTARRGEHLETRPDTLPPLDLLRPDAGMPVSGSLASSPGSSDVARTGGQDKADALQRAQVLKQTLAEFGVPVEVVSIKEGPTVTQFGLEPGEVMRETRNGEVQRRRVSVHSILRLSNDLALALAAASIRIEAPVPGRPYVGVEVPNAAKTLVSLRSVLESREFLKAGSPLAVALGRDVSGDPVVVDLDVLPHLLITGATGSGKSVCLNALICSLLMSNDPAIVRFIMVDPKMVELPAYNAVPHLVGNVITDPAQVPAALAWLTLQMDERYRLFADNGVRNIGGYNRKAARSRTREPLPYLLLVVDELADLMMSTAYDVERQICRLAQLSRATGIHLVLATQRPSVDVITGLIKANFPARIAFAVTTQIDSRVVLDAPGAEKLLGRGDMLYMSPDSAKLSRIQGCFVSDREIEAIVGFWKASYEERSGGELPLVPWADQVDHSEARDVLLEQALQLLRTKTHVSTSLLQRQLRIGFPRAARLMEQLEEMGVAGPDEGGGRSRRVLMLEDDPVDARN